MKHLGVFAFAVALCCAVGCTGRMRQLKARAAFDLDCPEQELAVYRLGQRSVRGVEGCGQRAVYILTRGGNWVLNSVSEGELRDRREDRRSRREHRDAARRYSDKVDRIIQENEAQVRACYQRHANDRGSSERLAVEIVIGRRGRVMEVAVIERRTTLVNPRAEDCILDSIMRWRFPRQREGELYLERTFELWAGPEDEAEVEI